MAGNDPPRTGSRVIEVEDRVELTRLLEQRDDLRCVVINGVDLSDHAERLVQCELAGAVLIGCSGPAELLAYASLAGAAVFPRFDDLPYRPYRKYLYSPEDLYEGFDTARPETYADALDSVIYQHWKQTGGPGGHDMVEALARRIHDHSITSALEDFIEGREVVAIMGGHGLSRDDPGYAAVCRIARALSRTGKLLASGGGPGAMEATHLGCWMSAEPDASLDTALGILSEAPTFAPAYDWLVAAFEVRERFMPSPDRPVSLGVPTWLYGHEPPNAFATHIAKYFANAVREDGLLTIATHGVVFTPGSAGTVQEIFQDATQNHYETVGPPSPMIFFGRQFWTDELPVVPLIERLGAGKRWLDDIVVTDDEDAVVAAIEGHTR